MKMLKTDPTVETSRHAAKAPEVFPPALGSVTSISVWVPSVAPIPLAGSEVDL
jgi:hypothetical protein